MSSDILGIGISGKSLTDLERRILAESTPYAIVLFGRNIGSMQQLLDLVGEIKSIAEKPPLIMIDEEGGRVDRLRNLVPGLPSAESFGEGENPVGMSEWFGRIIGMALRFFDIEVDLAPVVDIRGERAPKGLERRTFGRDPETVVDLAGAFIRGLHSQGVASCLKHWPGIGVGSADPHYGATVIDCSIDDLERRDLIPFRRLGPEAGAIMIGHGTYPQIDDPDLPATLSHKLTADLLRKIEFDGVAISDDMEMHAVSDLGSYEVICERALKAGNDVILYCSHIERIPDVQRFMRQRVEEVPAIRERFEDAVARAERYRRHCTRLREDGAPPVDSFDALIEEAIRFCDEFERTRPHRDIVVPDSDRRKGSRSPGHGRSGREEWT
ncbi:MAG TPA: glycoside hydrolase family 3 N-terminal domain-containing protein [Thermoanaerobaculia bacterium]|nr:glycoside hydrolase family 3 N-terminal domain-containing protein [Thermoanaerobaculia bacterium]